MLTALFFGICLIFHSWLMIVNCSNWIMKFKIPKNNFLLYIAIASLFAQKNKMRFSIMVDKTKRFSMQNQNTESQYLSNDVSIFVWLNTSKRQILPFSAIIRLSECPYCRFQTTSSLFFHSGKVVGNELASEGNNHLWC